MVVEHSVFTFLYHAAQSLRKFKFITSDQILARSSHTHDMDDILNDHEQRPIGPSFASFEERLPEIDFQVCCFWSQSI